MYQSTEIGLPKSKFILYIRLADRTDLPIFLIPLDMASPISAFSSSSSSLSLFLSPNILDIKYSCLSG